MPSISRKSLVILVILLLIVDGALLLFWLKKDFSSPNSGNKLKKYQKINQGEKEDSSFSFIDYQGKAVMPGFFSKNVGGGATGVGVLDSVRQEGNEVIARFRFRTDNQGLEMDFVVGLVEPEAKLHFFRSKTEDLLPLSKDTQVQQVEPKRIIPFLEPYINKPFRLILKEPYDEKKLRQQKVRKEVIELIRAINPYFVCNQKLIEANKLEVNQQNALTRAVNCKGAVFDLLTYDPNW